MAKKVQEILVDDLDGSVAAETVRFALDGVTFEIDLNEANAAQLRAEIGRWVAKARRTGGRRSRNTKPTGVPLAEIRKWAWENGYQVSDRGRVAATVQAAYEAAHA